MRTHTHQLFNTEEEEEEEEEKKKKKREGAVVGDMICDVQCERSITILNPIYRLPLWGSSTQSFESASLPVSSVSVAFALS